MPISKIWRRQKTIHLNTSEVKENNSLLNIPLKDKPQHVISANGSTKTVISYICYKR
jgi:hypothetical protein